MNLTMWELLQDISTIGSDLGIFAAFVGFIQREKIRNWFTRNRFPKEVGHPLDGAIHWDALIFTVSKPEAPCWVIDKLKPRHVGLIASPESLAVAEQIKAHAQNSHIEVLIDIIADADDMARSREAGQRLVSSLRNKGCKSMAIDLTGGKVTMSLGAFMAAEELGLHSLYVASEFNRELKQPDMRTAKILCVSQPQNRP